MIYGSLILMALFSVSYTYSYWPGIIGDSVSTNNEIPIGEWVAKRIIHVHSNLSQTFDDFDIEIEPDTSLGDDFNDYFKFSSLELDPLPKDHSGVDLSLYTFDDWYLPNGVTFTKNTVVSSDLDVYPSWNVDSSQFTYTYTSSGVMYNIYKTSGFNLTGDLYFPGWRYKGREINQLVRSGMQQYYFTNYDFGGSLTIGEGIKKISGNAFNGATATSLTLEEGLEDIQDKVFMNFHTAGDLIFPSTIKTVGQGAFQSATFDGKLDFSLVTQLETTGTNAFTKNLFQGDLVIGPSFVSINNYSFSEIPFNGVLDLSNASNLERIGSNAFVKSAFSTLIFPTDGKLNSIGTSAFQNTHITMNSIYLPNTLETIDGNAFSSCHFNNVYIPLSVTTLGNTGIFYGSSNATFYYPGSSEPPGWPVGWLPTGGKLVLNAIF